MPSGIPMMAPGRAGSSAVIERPAVTCPAVASSARSRAEGNLPSAAVAQAMKVVFTERGPCPGLRSFPCGRRRGRRCGTGCWDRAGRQPSRRSRPPGTAGFPSGQCRRRECQGHSRSHARSPPRWGGSSSLGSVWAGLPRRGPVSPFGHHVHSVPTEPDDAICDGIRPAVSGHTGCRAQRGDGRRELRGAHLLQPAPGAGTLDSDDIRAGCGQPVRARSQLPGR